VTGIDSSGNIICSAVTLLPGVLEVTPLETLPFSAQVGGEFPSTQSYALRNIGNSPFNWTVSVGPAWISISTQSGLLLSNTGTTVVASINSEVNSLTPGYHSGVLRFTNTTNDLGSTTRNIQVLVPGLDRPSNFQPSADLRFCFLNNIDLNHVDLRSANLYQASLQGANLIGTNLGGANLFNANMVQANLSGANLSETNLGWANLSAATLTQAILIDADLTDAYLGYESQSRGSRRPPSVIA
jgi:hypothetical protein